MNTVNIFDVLIVVSGLYMIYAAIVMKTQGKITGGIIVSKDVDVNQIRDKEGLIAYMFGKVLLIGIITCIVGVTGILLIKFNGPVYVSVISLSIFLIVLIWFAILSKKARKMFIDKKSA